MTVEDYIARCSALGIPSLSLREMPHTNPGSPQNAAEPDLLHYKTLAEAPRIKPPPGPDLSHLSNGKNKHVAREYWSRMTPEQRAVESAKRRENARGSRKV